MDEHLEIPSKLFSSSENRDSIRFTIKSRHRSLSTSLCPITTGPMIVIGFAFAWCLRRGRLICVSGCDQKDEEEMDSEVIYNNFVLPVMTAKSPNVRLRKSLDKNASRRKPVAAKYLTTPRNKKSTSDQSSFQSVQHPKSINVEVPKSLIVAKALVFRSPKKAIKSRKRVLGYSCNSSKKLSDNSSRRQKETKSWESSLDFENLVMKTHKEEMITSEVTKAQESSGNNGNNSYEGERSGLDSEDGDDKENAATSDENRILNRILKQNGRKILEVHGKCDNVRKKGTQLRDTLKEGSSVCVVQREESSKKPSWIKESSIPQPSHCENANVSSTPVVKNVGEEADKVELLLNGSMAVAFKAPKRQESSNRGPFSRVGVVVRNEKFTTHTYFGGTAGEFTSSLSTSTSTYSTSSDEDMSSSEDDISITFTVGGSLFSPLPNRLQRR
ncbi:hypothetical protein SASPL_115423 [Salvia splendens]|uniref:Uncharacterized protein n=1 Tax=Salvia splendens TaxID=180675 RepID=A0A8X8Y7J3_SALSN|nr:hypothetical protein SASPL_115423 [Salvia splendens]